MNTVSVAHCRSCGAEIIWLRNIRTNKVSPIEAEPHPGGNVRVWLDRGHFDIVTPSERREHPAGPYYLNHFATCSQAKRWKESTRSNGAKTGASAATVAAANGRETPETKADLAGGHIGPFTPGVTGSEDVK